MVGGGVTLEPADDAGVLPVLAPIDGKVIKVHPHAFVLLHNSGAGVLVHVGIDTVGLKGRGFTVHAEQGTTVSAGDLMVEVDVAAVRAEGLSATCPVVVLDSAPDSVTSDVLGRLVDAGEPLFSLP
jgi:glucose-specific phosphotransferase system IIA component